MRFSGVLNEHTSPCGAGAETVLFGVQDASRQARASDELEPS